MLTAAAVAADKTYDGTTSANATLSILSGLIGTETLGITSTASFNSKDVASANLVTVDSITLSDGSNGGLASNYILAAGQTSAAHITPRELTVVGQTALDKVYDGTNSATLMDGTLAGVVSGETVTLDQSGTFAQADIGNDIAVIATNSLNGSAAANYTLTQPAGLRANITAPIDPQNPSEPPTPTPMPTPTPTPPESPPLDVTSAAGYRGAVGHVAANAHSTLSTTPAPVTSASFNSPANGASQTGSIPYELAGLNLTVVTQEGSLPPGMPATQIEEEK